jgi:hypothetical protein
MEQQDANKVLKEIHDGLTGGHFAGETTTQKILRAYTTGQTYLKTHMLMSIAVISIKNLWKRK